MESVLYQNISMIRETKKYQLQTNLIDLLIYTHTMLLKAVVGSFHCNVVSFHCYVNNITMKKK